MLNCTVYKGGSIKYFFPSFLYCLLLSDWTIQLQSSEHPVHCMKMLMISYKVHFLWGPGLFVALETCSTVLSIRVEWLSFFLQFSKMDTLLSWPGTFIFITFFAYFISTSVSVWTRGSSISLHLHGITFHCNSNRLSLLVYLSFPSLFPPLSGPSRSLVSLLFYLSCLPSPYSSCSQSQSLRFIFYLIQLQHFSSNYLLPYYLHY